MYTDGKINFKIITVTGNEKRLQSRDGLHLSANGSRTLAHKIATSINGLTRTTITTKVPQKPIENIIETSNIMREHILKCIENDEIEMFPKVSKMPKMPCNDPRKIKNKLYCTCKMPDIIDDMIQCERKQCGKWFHKKCTSNPTIVDNWLCSFCSWD